MGEVGSGWVESHEAGVHAYHPSFDGRRSSVVGRVGDEQVSAAWDDRVRATLGHLGHEARRLHHVTAPALVYWGSITSPRLPWSATGDGVSSMNDDS